MYSENNQFRWYSGTEDKDQACGIDNAQTTSANPDEHHVVPMEEPVCDDQSKI